jgi:hypothetical protein
MVCQYAEQPSEQTENPNIKNGYNNDSFDFERTPQHPLVEGKHDFEQLVGLCHFFYHIICSTHQKYSRNNFSLSWSRQRLCFISKLTFQKKLSSKKYTLSNSSQEL